MPCYDDRRMWLLDRLGADNDRPAPDAPGADLPGYHVEVVAVMPKFKVVTVRSSTAGAPANAEPMRLEPACEPQRS